MGVEETIGVVQPPNLQAIQTLSKAKLWGNFFDSKLGALRCKARRALARIPKG